MSLGKQSLKIQSIAYALPERVLTNEQLHRDHPNWNMELTAARTGVTSRHIARDGETALDLALAASNKLLTESGLKPEAIDGLIFCTQSPDYIMPPNSCVLHKALELREDVFAYDFNLACSGFVYGLAMANGWIASGMAKNILLVTGDTYSRYIHPEDRGARVLFGDGASATWIKPTDDSTHLVDILCSTGGAKYESFIIPAGGCRTPKSPETSIPKADNSGNQRSAENIHMDGMGILVFVNTKVPAQIRTLLIRNALSIEDIDYWVFHQASSLALDTLCKNLGLPEEKVFRNLETIGNTVSSSIPIALRDAMDQGKIKKGQKVVLSGFGVGLSWSSAIYQF